MLRIRQHGDDNQVFDMHSFIDDTVAAFNICYWEIQIEWCIGNESLQVEQSRTSPKRYSTKGLTSLYSGLTQTVDGKISAYAEYTHLVTFEAVDSSYWEVSSKNEEFLAGMESKYGIYEINRT